MGQSQYLKVSVPRSISNYDTLCKKYDIKIIDKKHPYTVIAQFPNDWTYKITKHNKNQLIYYDKNNDPRVLIHLDTHTVNSWIKFLSEQETNNIKCKDINDKKLNDFINKNAKKQWSEKTKYALHIIHPLSYIHMSHNEILYFKSEDLAYEARCYYNETDDTINDTIFLIMYMDNKESKINTSFLYNNKYSTSV
jgi:hypothetical protein